MLSWDLLVWSTQPTLTKHHWWSTISQNLIYDIIYLALILKATKCLNRHHVSLSQNTIPKVYQKKLDFLKLAEFNKFFINLKLWIMLKIRIWNLRSCCLFQTLLIILMPNIHHLALNTWLQKLDIWLFDQCHNVYNRKSRGLLTVWQSDFLQLW